MNGKSTRGDRRVRVGEVCAGYGGLLLGVSLLLPGAELAWCAENDRHASWRKGETDSETIVGTVQRHLESLGYLVSWGIFSAAQTAAYLRFSSSG